MPKPSTDEHGRKTRRAFLLGAASAGLCLWGAGTKAGERGPVRSMLEMRRDGVVVQDWDLSCGAAALATILRYQHGESVTEQELLEELIRRDIYIQNPELVQIREGFSLLDLKRVAEGRGYNGFGYGNLTFEDALGLAPMITPISPKGYNHFAVLIGRRGDRMLLADPAFGNITMSEDASGASGWTSPISAMSALS